MPTLTVAIPQSLNLAIRNAAQQRGTSPDNLVNAALGEYLNSHHHRMYQISTSTALVEGVNDGAISSVFLLAQGDFGLGTFEHLDGEMVILDGAIYQVRGDGSATRRDDEFLIPFAVVTRYQEKVVFRAKNLTCIADVERLCDSHRESSNLFYALKVEGYFELVHARAVSRMAPGATLVDAAGRQNEFQFGDIEGTLIGLWSPGYSSTFNVPGYHFHFLSKDRTKGGHVLECTAKTVRVGLQTLCQYDVRLPDKGPFLTASLRKDPAAVLAKVE
jgi:acetolactate decarboxylase